LSRARLGSGLSRTRFGSGCWARKSINSVPFSNAPREDEGLFEKKFSYKISGGGQDKKPKAINLALDTKKSAKRQSKIEENGKRYCIV